MLSLLALIANTKVAIEGDDEVLSLYDSNGQPTVQSCCIEMYKGSTQLIDEAISKSKAPTKACFLAWAATRGKFQ